MKKTILFLTAILCLALAAFAAGAEETDILGKWYYSSYENTEDYPGTVFLADGDEQYFNIYTDGENLVMVDHRDGRNDAREAAYNAGKLTLGSETYTVEPGKLVRSYGPVIEIYTREPRDRQVPADRSGLYANRLRREDFNGTWAIVRYGVNKAFADAETMGISGRAVIEDGKLTLTWTRDGKEKSFEITFDEDLNNGRLYTVVGGAVSYIVSLRADHTILLNVGLYEAEWVMRKENVVSEETVHPDAPEFEQAFAAAGDWAATEEGRNAMAQLLVDTAIAGGADPDAIRTEGAFYLALVGRDAGYPVVICEGAGDCENYILHIGRGVSMETNEPFVYYRWDDRFFSSLCHPEESVTEYCSRNDLPIVAGENVWPVQVSLARGS